MMPVALVCCEFRRTPLPRTRVNRMTAQERDGIPAGDAVPFWPGLGWACSLYAYLGAAGAKGCAGATLGTSAPDCASSIPLLNLWPTQMAPSTTPIRIGSPKSPQGRRPPTPGRPLLG